MPGRKKSIWLGPPIQKLLASRASSNVSGAINTAVDRYLELCKRNLPCFTRREWCAIFDALNGCWLSEAWSVSYIFAEVHDSPELGDKWQIDQPALIVKLQNLTYAESVAVADAAERFWASKDDDIAAILGKKHIVAP